MVKVFETQIRLTNEKSVEQLRDSTVPRYVKPQVLDQLEEWIKEKPIPYIVNNKFSQEDIFHYWSGCLSVCQNTFISTKHTRWETGPKPPSISAELLLLFLREKNKLTQQQKKSIFTTTPSRFVRDQPATCYFVSSTFTYKHTPSLPLSLHPHIHHPSRRLRTQPSLCTLSL